MNCQTIVFEHTHISALFDKQIKDEETGETYDYQKDINYFHIRYHYTYSFYPTGDKWTFDAKNLSSGSQCPYFCFFMVR